MTVRTAACGSSGARAPPTAPNGPSATPPAEATVHLWAGRCHNSGCRARGCAGLWQRLDYIGGSLAKFIEHAGRSRVLARRGPARSACATDSGVMCSPDCALAIAAPRFHDGIPLIVEPQRRGILRGTGRA